MLKRGQCFGLYNIVHNNVENTSSEQYRVVIKILVDHQSKYCLFQYFSLLEGNFHTIFKITVKSLFLRNTAVLNMTKHRLKTFYQLFFLVPGEIYPLSMTLMGKTSKHGAQKFLSLDCSNTLSLPKWTTVSQQQKFYRISHSNAYFFFFFFFFFEGLYF